LNARGTIPTLTAHGASKRKGAQMSIHLNHTIVSARDKKASSAFLTEILGLPAAKPFGPFLGVKLDNDVTLDFIEWDGDIETAHFAFLVSEGEFDQIFARIKARGLSHWADPFHKRAGEINRSDGGRGLYFEDPSGHNLEILTRPYGSGAG
jgi:catechol 2,3-dioxygenase-like lactoylglutathione lyase family enzyme